MVFTRILCYWCILCLAMGIGSARAGGRVGKLAIIQAQAQAEGENLQADAHAHLLAGQRFLAKDKVRQAIQELELAVRDLDKATHPTLDGYEAYYGLGEATAALGDFHLALTYHFKAQQLADVLGKAVPQADVLEAVGKDLYQLKDYDRALEYLAKAKDATRAAGRRLQGADVVALAGDCYHAQGKSVKAIQQYRTALAGYAAAGDLAGQVRINTQLAATLVQLRNYPEAIGMLQKALVMADSAKMKDAQAAAYLGLAECFRGLSEQPKAVFYGSLAVAAARRAKAPEVEMPAHQTLAASYGELKKYEEALRHYRAYINLKDRAQNQDKARQIAEMQIRYESEKRGKAIALLTREKKIQELDITRKENLLWGAALVLGLSAVIAFVLHRRNRFEQEVNHQLQTKNEQISRQASTLQVQRDDLAATSKELNAAVERLRSSITYAKRIQDALLPDADQLRHCLPDPLIYFRPKDIVSGDFYWFDAGEDHALIAVADCTGHGVPGAIMSTIGNAVLSKAAAAIWQHGPAAILAQMHIELVAALQQQIGHNRDGIDIGLCYFNKPSREVVFAGAKNSLYIVEHGTGQAFTLPGDRHSIGGVQEEAGARRSFAEHRYRITGPCTIYMYTDGYADQFDDNYRRKFSLPRFRELLVKMASLPANEQARRLDEAITAWRGANEQTDDMLVVGMKIRAEV